jgi:hypothetical protein
MTTGSATLQSGTVTPGHLTSWVTDGVIGDAGIAIAATYGVFNSTVLGTNFNSSNTDFPLPIQLPVGFTRYRLHDILISGATASLTGCTCGVFTQASGLGQAVVTSGTAVTVSSTAADTANNMQMLTLNNQNTIAWSDTTLYFRVQNSQGSPAFANITVNYEPLP